jgi:hypothetical protein
MRRLFIICLLALSATALVVSVPAAPAAKKKASKPSITRVTPMRISVGARLTIIGRNFKAGAKDNTVIFRAPNGRSAFAKPRRASRNKLVVVVPSAVSRLLAGGVSKPEPTRLKLRVLAGKFSAFTPRRLSPVVTGFGSGDGPGGGKPGPSSPGGGSAGGGTAAAAAPCTNSADHDGDLIDNSEEDRIGTDRCLADTDGDQMTDGWEYWAAKDLNVKAVPYPGKRPFPNALDPSDGGAGATFSNVDFDGDGLTTLEEYRAWRFTGSSFDWNRVGGLDLESPLSYSDGTKFSRASETPAVPAWRSATFGLQPPTQSFPATYVLHADPEWHDDERDADGDGLANWLEAARGPGQPSWWDSYWNVFEPAARPWGRELATDCGQDFGAFGQRPFAALDLGDSDVDGDSLLDGEDDQDNDDYNNIVELYETEKDLDGDGGFTCTVLNEEGTEITSQETYPSIDVDPGPGEINMGINAFNPCAPNPNSRTCPDRRPF